MIRPGAPTLRSLRIALQLAAPFALALPACTCDDSLGQLKANVAVEPDMLDFGRVAIGGLKQLEVTVRNKGSLRITLSGFDADPPFIAPSGTSSIATGSTTKPKVGFSPTALGPVTGTFRISTSVSDSEQLEVQLRGEGIQAAVLVDPPLVDFGEVLWVAGATPMTRTITVSNPGTDSFELTAIELTDDGADAYTVDPMAAKKTYAPGDSGTLSVSLLPNARGTIAGALVIRTTAPEGEEITVPITARVVGPEIQLCENVEGQPEACVVAGGARPKLEFFVPRMGTGHGTITAKNVGDRDLHIGAVLVNGAAAELSLVPAPGMNEVVVPPGMSAPWAVTYTPQDYTFDSVIVSFGSDSRSASNPTGPSVESMRVDGNVIRPDLQVVPRNMTFRPTGGAHRLAIRAQLFNCGTDTLTLGAITLPQNGNGTFTLENVPNAGLQIPPQPSCSNGPEGAGFDVVFDTLTNGNYTGTVNIASDDPVNPTQEINLAATKD